MTDRAQPGAKGSRQINHELGEVTGSISAGFILDPTTPSKAARRYSDLDETTFDGFQIANVSSSSFDVTIGPGEAYVEGWCARDVTTTVNLQSDVLNQEIAIGWNPDATYDSDIHDTRDDADEMFIDTVANIEARTDPDPYYVIYEVDTDSNGVTDTRSQRDVGPTINTNNYTYDSDATGGVDQIDQNAVGSNELDNSGPLDASGGIENLPEPTADGDAARKAYVDAIEQGLDIKDSVRVATDGSNVDLGSSTDPNPIDGVTLADGDRVLLKDQSTASENGLYEAVTATDPTTWVRTADADEDDEVTPGLFTFVEEGSVNLNRGFVVTTTGTITLGSTSIQFTQFSGAGQVSAGTLLTKSGDTLNVSEDDINHDNIDQTTVSANDHHQDPTAGSFVVDEGTNQFGLDAESWTRDNPNGRTPIVALESGESFELSVFVPDGKTVKLYEANAVLVDEGATGGFTTDANLVAEIVDESGTVQYSNSGTNSSAEGSTLYSEQNSSGGIQLWKIRVNNTDGSATFDSPGAIGEFSVVVE